MDTITNEANYARWNSILLGIAEHRQAYPDLSREEVIAFAHRVFEREGGTEQSWNDFYEYAKRKSAKQSSKPHRYDKLRFMYHQLRSPNHDESKGLPEDPFIKRRHAWKLVKDIPVPSVHAKKRETDALMHTEQLELLEAPATRHYPDKHVIIMQVETHEKCFDVSRAHALRAGMNAHGLVGELRNKIIGKVQTKLKKDAKEEEKKKKRAMRGKKGKLHQLGEALTSLVRAKRLARTTT